MRKVQFMLVAAALLSTSSMISSCKKKEKDPTSTWTVNGETFSTNEYRIDKGKAISYFQSINSSPSGFDFVFHSGYFATGSFQVECGNPDPTYECFDISYNKANYLPTSKAIVRTIYEDGKPVYSIDSMWMFNETNANDSVLLKGATFKSPIEH